MIKTKVAFLEGRLLSSQSEQSEKFPKSSDWLEKSYFCFDHVNRLNVLHYECYHYKTKFSAYLIYLSFSKFSYHQHMF